MSDAPVPAQCIVFVRLPDEAVEVYRPVHARPLGKGIYELTPPAEYQPDVERWEFPAGSLVICENRELSDGTVPVAIRLAISP